MENMGNIGVIAPVIGVIGLLIAYVTYLGVVKQPAGTAKMEEVPLIEILRQNKHFQEFQENLTNEELVIMSGGVHNYLGHSIEQLESNVAFVRETLENLL